MYCDLQSRGIKRKFGEEDDSGDQTQRLRSDGISRSDAISRSDGISRINSTIVTKVNNFSMTKNNIQTITSRILQHNLSVQNCFVRQRQQIFNISMCKLNRFRQSPDPSLLRSVLICNTLRTLERELEREGIKINFGPNGVSFIPPVLNTQNIILDPPPSASSSSSSSSSTLVNQNHPNYFQVSSSVEADNDNTNGEYDKYLLDLNSSLGRVTPFHKSLSASSSVFDREPSLDFTSTSLTQSANSAFWGSDEASDRLTSLNWSSVLNFNSSVNTVTGANKTTQYSTNGLEANDSNQCVSSPHQSSDNSSNNNTFTPNSKSNTTSFTTLLPPSTSSSVVTSITTATTTSASLSSTTLSSPSVSQNSISSQNVINSQHMNHISVINSNSIPYSSNATNDEIFGDIDLSLYDFDLLSPLSPPNVKLAPITAEELIRTISPTDSNSSGVSSSSSITSTSSSISSPLSSSSTSSSSACSSTTSGFHGRYFKSSDKLFTDDRDQQAITPVMS
jgi:hypothetical protein